MVPMAKPFMALGSCHCQAGSSGSIVEDDPDAYDEEGDNEHAEDNGDGASQAPDHPPAPAEPTPLPPPSAESPSPPAPATAPSLPAVPAETRSLDALCSFTFLNPICTCRHGAPIPFLGLS